MPCTLMPACGSVRVQGIKNLSVAVPLGTASLFINYGWLIVPQKAPPMSSPHYKPAPDVRSSFLSKDQGGNWIIKARAFDIIWGGDNRYWRTDDSKGSVELLQVSWLEITGSLELSQLEKDREYKVSFSVSLKADAFGWADSPVYLMAKVGKKGPYIWKKADLSLLKPGATTAIPQLSVLKFRVPNGAANEDKLQFGMYEIWKGRWKGGLVIEDVVISPC